VALFSLDDYSGQIMADLFGEDSYFVNLAAKTIAFRRCGN
jgi:hypothetical protein